MKREELKALDLADDVIDKIMGIHGKDVQTLQNTNDQLKTQAETLQTQVVERDKDLKELKKSSKDNDELTSKYEDLQKKYQTDTEQLQKSLTETKFNTALTTALTGAKVRNPDAIKGLLNMDDIKLGDDGKVSGLDAQLEALQKSDGYLFDQGEHTDYTPKGGKGGGTENEVQKMIDVFKGSAPTGGADK